MFSDTRGYVEHGVARGLPSLVAEAKPGLYRYTFTAQDGETFTGAILARGNSNARVLAALSHGCLLRRIRVHGPVS